MTHSESWAFANEAYEGSGGFDDKSYIDKHTRESDDKYSERKKIAYYSNKFVQKISRYNGYLFKNNPIRSSSNKMVEAVFADCDNTGNSMDIFMSSFAKGAKVRGTGIVLIDMPSDMPDNAQSQIEERALPYFVDIKPEDITSYKLDKFGNFVWVAYADTLDNSTFEEEDIVNITRYYDALEWRILDEDDSVLESGSHSLGICPVIFFGENGVFPDIGEFTQVAKIAKDHFNESSEMRDIMRSQTFSILTLQADNPSDVTLTLSTDNAIKYGSGMERPGFISPDSAPVDAYKEKLIALEDNMNEICYDLSTNLSDESGIALDIKFQGLNGSLSNFAQRLQGFELALFEVVCLYLGVNNDVEVLYPKEFNIIDTTQEIATLASIKELGYTLPNYETTKVQQIIGSDLSNVSQDQMNIILAEIEDGLKEVAEVEPKESKE